MGLSMARDSRAAGAFGDAMVQRLAYVKASQEIYHSIVEDLDFGESVNEVHSPKILPARQCLGIGV